MPPLGGGMEISMKKLLEGKSKILYEDGNSIIMKYKGDVRCSNQKVVYSDLVAKERVRFTYQLFKLLHDNLNGILMPEIVDESSLKMKKVMPIPLEWIPRYVAAGSVVKRFGFKEGKKFNDMVLKIDYKTDLEDYLITDQLIVEKGILSEEELFAAKVLCKQVAECIQKHCIERQLEIWDFKMELGRDSDGQIVLIDEISLDGMRLKDMKTKKDYDKDVYRKTGDIEKLIQVYREGYNRLFI